MTNGYNHTEVLTTLFSRLGWRQGTLDVPTLSAANLLSNSGRYFNDAHPLVTIKNIKDTVEDYSKSDSEFNTYLGELQNSVIADVLNRVFQPKFWDAPKTLFERTDGADSTTENDSLFVGYRIRPAADNGVMVQANALTLLFDGAATFNVYLFHDRKSAPLKTKSVTTVANQQVVVDLTEWFLPYLGTTTGGSYFIGYFQDDLGSAKAINESVCWNSTFCFKYESALAEVAGAAQMGSSYSVTGRTGGLNIEMSSFADYTKKIIRNASLFDNAVGLGMAVKVLESLLYSVNRSNGTERNLKEVIAEATYDLSGALPIAGTAKKRSLKEDYSAALEVLHNQFSPNPKSTVINLC